MDEKTRRYREQAAELQRVAHEMPDGATRKILLETVADYEKMAGALDEVAPADHVHPKHPGV